MSSNLTIYEVVSISLTIPDLQNNVKEYEECPKKITSKTIQFKNHAFQVQWFYSPQRVHSILIIQHWTALSNSSVILSCRLQIITFLAPLHWWSWRVRFSVQGKYIQRQRNGGQKPDVWFCRFFVTILHPLTFTGLPLYCHFTTKVVGNSIFWTRNKRWRVWMQLKSLF